MVFKFSMKRKTHSSLEASDTSHAATKEYCATLQPQRTARQVVSQEEQEEERMIREGEDGQGILTIIDHAFQRAHWKSLWSWRVVVEPEVV